MSGNDALRVRLAWSYFVVGLFVLVAAYVPAHWEARAALGVTGVIALALSALFERTKLVRQLLANAPSGRVTGLKRVFKVVTILGLIPALLGLVLTFQQHPVGFPNAPLAIFCVFPFACAYLLLAAPGHRMESPGERP